MKATELMIGDWVVSGQYVTTVKSLGDKIALNGCTGKVDEVWAVNITPAILEKNGFKHGIGHVYYKFFEEDIYPHKFCIEYNALNWCLFINEGLVPQPIQYVHQIQHALRLCGIKDDIVLL